VLPLPSLNVQKQEVTDTHYLNVLEIMNSIHTLLTIAIALCAFILGVTVAGYSQFNADPPEHYNIQSRALNYTDKDCYSKIDIELIVFGKVLDHE
jgi:uncharacterized membrane protein